MELSAPSRPALRLDGVSKSFGGVAAVRGLSMTVPTGDIIGLIGPNGAGKTTALNLIAGMLALTSGQILMGRTDISRAAPYDIARAGIARTFQNIRLLGEASALENVMAGLHLRERCGFWPSLLGLPAAARETRQMEEVARGLLEQLGLAALARQPARELSYGHQRKVEIARALATDPLVLLLDEPVAGMNDVEADEIAGVLRAIAARGIGILLIEHNMRFVMGLCDAIVVMNAGETIAAGPPARVASDPRVISAYLGA